jgi:hypothetical protein
VPTVVTALGPLSPTQVNAKGMATNQAAKRWAVGPRTGPMTSCISPAISSSSVSCALSRRLLAVRLYIVTGLPLLAADTLPAAFLAWAAQRAEAQGGGPRRQRYVELCRAVAACRQPWAPHVCVALDNGHASTTHLDLPKRQVLDLEAAKVLGWLGGCQKAQRVRAHTL